MTKPRVPFGKILAVLPLLLVLALATAPALAQPPGPPGHSRHGWAPGFPFERILESLNLTAEQHTAVDKIVSAQRGAAPAERERFMTARKALMEQVHAETFDEQAIRQAAAAVAALEADRAVEQAKTLGEIRAVLTPEQRTQLKETLSKHEAMMEEPRP